MLSLRMILFCAAAGICLWGLFNLLDNLHEPGLLRSAKAVVVKGCTPAESDEAEHLCPQLYCQKALLDSKAVPLRTRFAVTIDTVDKDSPQATHLIAGTVDNGADGFACLLENTRVTVSRRLSAAGLAALAGQSGNWRL